MLLSHIHSGWSLELAWPFAIWIWGTIHWYLWVLVMVQQRFIRNRSNNLHRHAGLTKLDNICWWENLLKKNEQCMPTCVESGFSASSSNCSVFSLKLVQFVYEIASYENKWLTCGAALNNVVPGSSIRAVDTVAGAVCHVAVRKWSQPIDVILNSPVFTPFHVNVAAPFTAVTVVPQLSTDPDIHRTRSGF